MILKEQQLKKLLKELKEGLNAIYGSRIKGLHLYGSYARGEQENDSDVDALVVLDRYDHYLEEVRRSGQLASDLSLKYGVSLSRVFVTENDWKLKNSIFLENVREEAMAA